MGVEYYRFWVEHHIECKIRFHHVMHFRTGGISRDWNPHVAHPAVVRSPPVINELFCDCRGVTWRERAEQLLQNGSLRPWKRLNSWLSSQALLVISAWTHLRVETLHQSLMCFCTRLLYFLLHEKRVATCVVTSYKNTLGDRQLNRNWCFFSSLKWAIFLFLYCLIVRYAADWRSAE